MKTHSNGRHSVSYVPRQAAGPPPGELPGKDWLNVVEHWIGQHPVAGIAAAVLAGVALGWLVKRR